MPRPLIGSTFGSAFRYLGFVLGSALPPDFSPDSTLLMFANGKNTDGTHKTDLINDYDMVAVEGPCLTLAEDDTIEVIGHGTFTSNIGTGTATYDGTDLTVIGAGSFFKLQFSDGTIFPCSEGAGDDGTNATIMDTTGQHTGAITAAVAMSVAWFATQDVYMDGNDRGWHEIEAPDDDGIYYPADPTTAQLNMFQFEVVGDSTMTVDGDDYTVGLYTIEGLSGATPLTVTYGVDDDQTVFTGDTVTGSSPNFSIDIDSSKVIVATMSEAVAGYSLDIDVTGDSTITIASTGYTSAGSPHTITGLTGATPMVVTYGGDDDQTAFTNGDWADVTGTDPNFSVDMDENKSFSVTTSQETFTLTLAVTGDSTVTIDTVDYTSAGSPYDIDAAGVTTMAITYGGSDDLTEWSGTDFGDVTGSDETWSITMDEAKSISCDCSEEIILLIDEGFEGTGIPSGWTEPYSSPDYEYDTSPAPLEGSYSMGSEYANCSGITFPGQSEVFVAFQIQYNQTWSGGYLNVFEVGGATIALLDSGTFQIVNFGGGTPTSSAPMPVDTHNYVWLRYKTGTGANAEFDLYLGTDGTFANATQVIGVTNGTRTTDIDRLECQYLNQALGGIILFDGVKMSASEIGDV